MNESPTREDRLFPAEPATRAIARELYASVAAHPIISPHGHVPVELLVTDEPFSDPADLFIGHDHYVTRLLHATGIGLERLGVKNTPADPREVWRALAEHWHIFAGTASGYWLAEALNTVLGIEAELGPSTSDHIYDRVAARLAEPEFRPRALFERFRIDTLATTDDALDTLEAHRKLASSTLAGRVLPTFRPDRFTDVDAIEFAANIEELLAATGSPVTFAGYLVALEERRDHFIRNGAVSADHGVTEPYTLALEAREAERLFADVMSGRADDASRRAFRGHMLWQMARMSVQDGLVMTLHAGVHRNHHRPTFERFGPDTGHDIPISAEFTRNLRPLLESFGHEKDFHLVLFTIDETAYSREIAPLAGFYPSVYIGAPWWFLDAPDAMLRFRQAVTETAGFTRGSGFIDDTRAFLSIPVRHDVSRRVDAAFLARMVVEGRMSVASAYRTINDLVDGLPRRVFKL